MIRVLVVDDSAVARSMLVRGLERYPDIRVIGEASDVYEARDHILTDDPDVITLDIRMPRMDGVNFLRKLMPQYPKAVVIVSALDRLGADDVLAALEAGAVDVVAKPGGVSGRGLSDMLEELVLKVRAAADADVSLRRQVKSPRPARRGPAVPVLQNRSDTLIAVGASTGGTVAVGTLLSDLPPMMPGILVTLHMPPIFTEKFAERLNQSSPHDVKEARDGVPVRVGSVLVAPGDRHMAVFRIRGEYRIRISDTPKVNGHKPSVGVLFSSVAREAGPSGIGVLLTGMGRDGSRELGEIKRAGGRTIAQDEASSVVWGMPAEAVKLGAAEKVLPLDRIGWELNRMAGA